MIKILGMSLITQTGSPAIATLTLESDGKHQTTQATAKGPIGAIFAAIRKIVPHDHLTLERYEAKSLGSTHDAVASVRVQISDGCRVVGSTHEDIDTFLASAWAYVGALNEMFVPVTVD